MLVPTRILQITTVFVTVTTTYHFKMLFVNFIELYDIFEHKTNGPVSISVIEKLQSWNLLARDCVLKCKNGHYLKLYPDVRSLDGFGWRCRAPINKQKNKCDYYQSIRVDTFFHKSHLSLYQIVSFAYLWLENVSLSFIVKQIKIAQHTAVDWSSFHREVVFEAMITNHNKIGKFKITYLRIKS